MSRVAEGEIKVDKPKGEIILVVLEELAILGIVGIYLAELITGVFKEERHGERALWAGFVSWVCQDHL